MLVLGQLFKRNSKKKEWNYIDTFAESTKTTNVTINTLMKMKKKTLLTLLKQNKKKIYKLSCCVKNKNKKIKRKTIQMSKLILFTF